MQAYPNMSNYLQICPNVFQHLRRRSISIFVILFQLFLGMCKTWFEIVSAYSWPVLAKNETICPIHYIHMYKTDLKLFVFGRNCFLSETHTWETNPTCVMFAKEICNTDKFETSGAVASSGLLLSRNAVCSGKRASGEFVSQTNYILLEKCI